jgi:(5-formylfuran-3-yl)methyl phosphate synthase
MQLLVSVANAAEALAALEGGADVIDAKDPFGGPLGRVTPSAWLGIRTAVAGARTTTAALGDAVGTEAVERDARRFAATGATYVKIGFAGSTSPVRVAALLEAAVQGVHREHAPAGVIAVAYADAHQVSSISPPALVTVAARAGAAGILLDTAVKSGPGLRALVTARVLTNWVAEAHQAGLIVAIAGQLSAADLPHLHETRADILGVRGAACEGGRGGPVSTDKVRLLRRLCAEAVT